MNPSAASRYWGIDNPIARRNMKSGATKRRQEDIEAERGSCTSSTKVGSGAVNG
jgi:hypothetical protein